MDLVIDVYQTTDRFPSQEKYGLTDQIRRATISIPSNIAEGAARQTKKNLRITFIWLRDLSASWIHRLSLQDDSDISMAKLGGFLMNGWNGLTN